MGRAKVLRICAAIVLAAGLGASGCTHNYYYGGAAPICGEMAAGPVMANGAVCEVPGQGTVISQAPTTIISGAPRAQRVVVSEPATGLPVVRGNGNPFSWRRSDPPTVATKVEGALSDDTAVNR